MIYRLTLLMLFTVVLEIIPKKFLLRLSQDTWRLGLCM